MANNFLNPTVLAKEALRVLHNKSVMIPRVYREYDKSWNKTGAPGGNGKIGPTLSIRKPNKFALRTGSTMNVQDISEESIQIERTNVIGVDFEFGAVDLTNTIEEFSARYLAPAMSRIAAGIDTALLNLWSDVPNYVGSTTPTDPSTAKVYLEGKSALSNSLAPTFNRKAVISTEASAETVDGLKGLFNAKAAIDKQYMEGAMGDALGFSFAETANIARQTVGTRSGTILVDQGTFTQGLDTIHVDGLGGATQTFKKGEIVSFAGVYDVNDETKTVRPTLKKFVVTADVTAAASEATLNIYPAMYSTGAKQNVSALPADNAAVTVTGAANASFSQNLLFHPEAFALVSADLIMPNNVDFAAREVMDGISLRIVRNYDIKNDKFPVRIDVLYGTKTINPEFACRLLGK